MPTDPPSTFPPLIGRYRLVRRLGAGAMGEVFEGEDAQLGRRAALKLLSKDMAASPELRERFRREAVAMAKVAHPHVVQVYELGEHEGLPFFAMELVDGGDCAALLERTPTLDPAEAARLIYEAALGLGAAAKQGLVHRDVKPANLLLHQGSVKVADFGIARAVQSTGGLTQYGVVMGTPEYMAPEQAMGMPLDLRADLYALGITLFQLATGHLPFTSPNPADILRLQVDQPLPDPRGFRAELPEVLVRLAARMAEKDPARRPQSYEEVCADLAPLCGRDADEDGQAGALIFTDGPLAGRKVAIGEGELVVGRQPDCNLVLDDQQSSRRHAVFVRDGSGLLVRDLGSRNGVLVNGARVTSTRLKVGDVVLVGSTSFKVAVGPKPGGVRPAAATGGAALQEARLALLCQLSRAAARGDSEETVARVLPSILGGTPELLPISRLALVRWEEGRQRSIVHEAKSAADKVVPLQAVIQAVYDSGQLLSLRDARADARFASVSGEVAAVLCAPLRGAGKTYGALYADAREPRAFRIDDLTFFETVANTAAAGLVKGIQESELKVQVRKASQLERSYSPALVQLINALSEADSLKLEQPRELEATVLFSDIQGFTRWSERKNPVDVGMLLNSYFGRMAAKVFDAGGMLDKFIGDAVMAVFGAPFPNEKHALQAVECALAMLGELRLLHRQVAPEDQFQIRVGVNTGPLVFGRFGAPMKQDFTVLGDTVNTAQRLESKAPAMGLLVGERTWQLIRHAYRCKPSESLQVKGKSAPINAYEVVGRL